MSTYKPPKAKRDRSVSYTWSQYMGDGMFTVKRIITEDYIKVYTQTEAEAWANKPVEYT
jgi:hypothetical protein